MGLWTYIFGVDEEQARLADNATAQAKQSAFLHYTRGEWTLAQYNSTIARLDGNLQDNATAESQIKDAFVEGAKDGLNNVKNTLQDATSFTLGSAWKIIPWQFKVVGGILLAVWLWNWLKTIKSVTTPTT